MQWTDDLARTSKMLVQLGSPSESLFEEDLVEAIDESMGDDSSPTKRFLRDKSCLGGR